MPDWIDIVSLLLAYFFLGCALRSRKKEMDEEERNEEWVRFWESIL